jgi:YVTN family beta-propeller protein
MKKAILSLVSLSLLTFSATLRADSVLTTITVGSEPTGIAANPVTNKIYVAIDGTGELAVIDGKTQQVKSRLTIGRFAIAVAVNPFNNRVYASACGDGPCNIWVIDGKTDTIITNIPVNSGQFLGIQGLAVNPVTNRIYATDADNEQYIVIDGSNNSIITMVPVFTQPARVAVNPKTNRIYIGGDGFPGFILVYDGATNAELARIDEGFNSVVGVATNFRLNRAYGTVQSGTLAVLDGNNQQIDSVPTGAFPAGVDVNLLNNKVYVGNANGQSVTIIDGNSDRVIQTLPIPATFPTDLAVNQGNGFTYVSDFNSDKVIVLQPN